MEKRGIFFSTDAIVAVTIILAVLLIAYPQIKTVQKQSDLPQDILKSLSSLKVKEIQNSQVQSWIAQGIVDPEKYILDQIGIFVLTNISMAQELANISLTNVKINENMGIWYGNKLIFSFNQTPYESAQNINTERYLISGIGGLNGTGVVSGFSARGFLSSDVKTKYFYFGGYVGDGNITGLVEYNGNITSAEMELAIKNNFSLYINGVSAGSYIQSPSETTPSKYDLNSYLNYFQEGNNTLEMRGNSISIAGGFIKITYQSNETFELAKRYYIPGIDGLINIYDGFYLPSNLSNIEITLDMDSNYTTFLNIGNVTVFNRTTDGRELIKLNNTYLASKLGNYYKLENKTIPLRLGIENLSIIPITQADVISVTDLSGSMSGQKMTDAKAANRLLISIILNNSKNRLGLAGFESYAKKLDFHNWTNVSVSLNNTVNNQWDASGNTCICCGILKAISCVENRTFMDNFNGQTVGTIPIGWTVLSSPSPLVNIVADDALEGDRSVKVTRRTSIPYAYHKFNPQQDAISIEFRINNSVESGNNQVRLEVESVDSGGTSYDDYILFKMSDGQIRNGNTAVIPYNLNQAYKIKISLTPGSSTYSLYVNDALISSSLSVASTRDNVASLRFTTEGSQSYRLNYTFDDVKVYHNKNLCEGLDLPNRTRAMIVMSDGDPNRVCGMDPVPDWDGDSDITEDPQDHSIQAACNAHNLYNFTVHAVAFDVTPGSIGDTTMQKIATCGGGSYYSSNLTQLLQVYQDIANLILATYSEQTISALVSGINTKLYPHSFIELKYSQRANPFGLIITAENKFSNTTAGNFSVPAGSSILETKVTSYSGSKWSHKLNANNNLAYDVTRYGNTFVSLGDPYSINIPNSFISSIIPNNVALSTAVSLTNTSAGSASNKIIYTVIKNFSSFSPIAPSAEGCTWTIGFESGNNITTTVPPSYTGANTCFYHPPLGSGSYDSSDAFQTAVYNLLQQLDFDSDGLVDVEFPAQAFQIDLSQVTGIPYTYNTEVQARTWS